MKTIFFFIFLIFLICSVYATDSEYIVIRLNNPTPELISYIIENDYEIVSGQEMIYIDILIDDHLLGEFIELGWEPEILFTESEMRRNLVLRTRELAGYRSYTDVLDELTDIASDYPNIASLYSLGISRGREYYLAGNNNYAAYNHLIWGLKVTLDPSVEADKPAVYYNGAHHAREPISVEVVMHILWHIIDNYGTDPEITFLVDNTEIWFIPMLNPDGHKLVFDEINTNWRKNIRDNYNTGTISTGDGVDLNRNYAHEWQLNAQPTASNYGGPYPSSEPETTALKNLWQERQFVAGISYHSSGQLVLFPPGYTSGLISPDVQAQYALALEMAQSIPTVSGTGTYIAQHSWQLYPATGTCEDDSYCAHGIFAHTLELATLFIPPVDQIDQICENNLEAALILLRRGHYSTLTGILTDAQTQEPIVAEIFIDGIDNTGVYRAPYTSSEEYGRYFRLLLPGEYTVQFSAPGYITSTPIYFSINSTTQTILDYQLIPDIRPEITSITVSEGIVTLQWNEIELANGYIIYSALTPDTEDWDYVDFTTETEWSGYIANDSIRFFRITAVY
ncbi:MAG: hypothetical protein K0B81_09370 [Candidatus Cloacimonetes bacterium]|nr:hypothetical protein [Candidatus Cloacimonadota bacterium]